MKVRVMPWIWLVLGFAGYGLMSFFVADAPLPVLLWVVGAAVGGAASGAVAGALVKPGDVAIALAGAWILFFALAWSSYRSGGTVGLVVTSGVWIGAMAGTGAFVEAGNQLLQSLGQQSTFIVLAGTALAGLVCGWLMSWSFPG